VFWCEGGWFGSLEVWKFVLVAREFRVITRVLFERGGVGGIRGPTVHLSSAQRNPAQNVYIADEEHYPATRTSNNSHVHSISVLLLLLLPW